MKLIHLIREAWDTKIDYDVVRSTPRVFRTRAIIGGREVIFTADVVSPNAWEFDFKEVQEDGSSTFKTTGSGSAMQVMAFVEQSLKELITVYAPERILFSVNEDNSKEKREKIFSRFLTRNGYKLEHKSTAGKTVKILTFNK